MNAIDQPSKNYQTRKVATLTAVAAACAMVFSAPANAAETDTTATAVSAPSAIDSSKRVYRRATPTANTNSAQQNTAQQIAPSNISQSTMTQPPMTTASAVQADNSALDRTTRVYDRGPMTSTGIDIKNGQLPNIPTPQVTLSEVSFVPTVLIAQQGGLGTDKLDVSLLDDFIEDVSPNARHYPPNFPNRSQRYYTREKIKVLTDWIDPYAKSPNASYDVLLRAAKLNGMGRNLDLGSDYAVRGGQYIARAIKANPDSGEANFLYGLMLSEGGGFKEGQKYLDRAVSLGNTEAEQSLAQSDLLSDRRSEALDRLRRLEQKMPNNAIITQQIKLVEDGKFYIWDIPAPDINVKPSS